MFKPIHFVIFVYVFNVEFCCYNFYCESRCLSYLNIYFHTVISLQMVFIHFL